MQELITRLASQLGIDPAIAQKAVGIILGFLQQAGPEDKVNQLMDQLPGAREALAAAPEDAEDAGAGGIGSSITGALASVTGGDDGIMGSLSKLQGLGLDMGQAKSVAEETMNFAKEKADGDLVEQIKDSIPALKAFL